MHHRRPRLPRLTLLALGGLLGLAAVGTAATSGEHALRGTVTTDGSSTVSPYVQAAAGPFMKKHRGVRVTVGISGTGGGFEKFCRGEIDLANASRPIKQSESASCRENGVNYVAFTVALATGSPSWSADRTPGRAV